MQTSADNDLATLWLVVTSSELDAIDVAEGRAWPSDVVVRAVRSRTKAVAAVRKLIATKRSDGAIVSLQVRSELLRKYPDLRIPRAHLADLEGAIASDIDKVAGYRRPIGERATRAAERALGFAIPRDWRNYLQRDPWCAWGSMNDGSYLTLEPPAESVALIDALAEFDDRAGMFPIGGDGGGEMLTLDIREKKPQVMLTPMIGIGWTESIVQSPSIRAFVQAVDRGTFTLAFKR